jgi:hypothetical protein
MRGAAEKFIKVCGLGALFLLIAPGSSSIRAVEKGNAKEGGSAAAENLAFLVFEANPDASYDIGKNGSGLVSVVSTTNGTIGFSDLANTLDTYSFIMTGSNPQPPSAPSGLTVVGGDAGCAQCDWLHNPEPNVTGYRLYFGASSVAQGAAAYDDSVDVTGTVHFNLCGLVEGNYYFALRAINSFGLLSTYSQEVSAYVGTGSAQGPSPPQQVGVVESTPGCASVSWSPNSEVDIAGYMVFYGTESVAGGVAAQYTDSLDAGNATAKTVCGLAPGTYYFAVKAYNTSGVYSAYSIERVLDVQGADLAAPTFSNLSPADGSIGVPLNTAVAFTVSDAMSGVDTNSVAVLINGSPPASIVFSGDAAATHVSCKPGSALPVQSLVTVSVTAGDRAVPSNVDSVSWSFTTGSGADGTPPEFCCLNPGSGSADVSPSTNIVIGISDSESGVDPGSLKLFVNDLPADYTLEGDDNKNLRLVYVNTEGFPLGEVVRVRVDACDLALPANCSSLLDYSFTVSATPDAAGAAAIVPDGFWAEDPTKPLQVKNIPLGWTVRIFDVSGRKVRTFKNEMRDGLDWTWDFKNDGNRRVVRSLYLVRVTDASGRVRQAGRFLVQRVP